VDYNPLHSKVSFHQDPVCARIAMSMMLKSHVLSSEDEIPGRDPQYWTRKLSLLV